MLELLSSWLPCAAGWDRRAAAKHGGQVWGRGEQSMGGAEGVERLADGLHVNLGCLADAPAAPTLGRLEGARAGQTRMMLGWE